MTIRGNSIRAHWPSGIEVDYPSAMIGNTVTNNDAPNLGLTGTGCISSQNATVD